MSFRFITIVVLIVLGTTWPVSSANKTGPRLVKLDGEVAREVQLGRSLALGESILIEAAGEPVYRVEGWVVGYELFKTMIDPAASTDQPYPFLVTEICMPMIFDSGTDLVVSVDIEAVDRTTMIGCSLPGELLALSSEWRLDIPPEGGRYNIWVPLDSPLEVTGPFFAGFYIGNEPRPTANPAVLTDTISARCSSFNVWEESIGWVDLGANHFGNFPGRLVMSVRGISGGGLAESIPLAPAIDLIWPQPGDLLFGATEIWAWETSGSRMIDHVQFEYGLGASFTEISRDYDGSTRVRDGLTASDGATGYRYRWDFSSLPAGTYTLRATAWDTLGRSSTSSILVDLEPIGPTMKFVSPTDGDTICPPFDFLVSAPTEEIISVEFKREQLQENYSIGLAPLRQDEFRDGRVSATGELTYYSSGGAATAMATKIWLDRLGSISISTDIWPSSSELAQELDLLFDASSRHGTSDEALVSGLADFCSSLDNRLSFDIVSNPDYTQLRTSIEYDEATAILGLGGEPGLWVAVDGFVGWRQENNTYQVAIADPRTGTIDVRPWRTGTRYDEILIGGVWKKVDLMVSIFAPEWVTSHELLGVDVDGADGWSLPWSAEPADQNTVSFYRATGQDKIGHLRSTTIMAAHDCSSIFVPGDYNNDRQVNIGDLYTLMNFFVTHRDPPIGGAFRADANCDKVINITDLVFYMNFLYGQTDAPCH